MSGGYRGSAQDSEESSGALGHPDCALRAEALQSPGDQDGEDAGAWEEKELRAVAMSMFDVPYEEQKQVTEAIFRSLGDRGDSNQLAKEELDQRGRCHDAGVDSASPSSSAEQGAPSLPDTASVWDDSRVEPAFAAMERPAALPEATPGEQLSPGSRLHGQDLCTACLRFLRNKCGSACQQCHHPDRRMLSSRERRRGPSGGQEESCVGSDPTLRLTVRGSTSHRLYEKQMRVESSPTRT